MTFDAPTLDLNPINEVLEAIGLTLVLSLTALKLDPLTEAMAELCRPYALVDMVGALEA
jgi:hypothetical protein